MSIEDNKILMDIHEKIGRLEGTVKVGFEQVNRRLDKTNGTLVDHDRRININEENISRNKGSIRVIQAKAGVVGAIAGLLVAMVGIAISFLKK